MKKITFLCIAFFSFCGTLCAEFTLGLQGGIFSSLMLDFDKRAIASYVRNSSSSSPATPKYHTFTYEQYGYFLNEKDEIAISPVAALTFGYEAKRFSFWTGGELIYNVNENFSVKNPNDGKVYAVVGYTYSLINIPLIINLYFLSRPKIKLGLLLGAYISFPLGDVQKSLPGVDGKPLYDIFNHNQAVNNLTLGQTGFFEDTLQNDISAGVRAGLASEFTLGRGALTLDVIYMRALTGGTQALILSGDTKIEDTERKITILSGVRISLGYKFRIGRAQGGAGASTVSESGRYFMVVRDTVEGPFSLADMRIFYMDKKLNADTMLWKKGLTDWVKASTFSELNNFFEE